MSSRHAAFALVLLFQAFTGLNGVRVATTSRAPNSVPEGSSYDYEQASKFLTTSSGGQLSQHLPFPQPCSAPTLDPRVSSKSPASGSNYQQGLTVLRAINRASPPPARSIHSLKNSLEPSISPPGTNAFASSSFPTVREDTSVLAPGPFDSLRGAETQGQGSGENAEGYRRKWLKNQWKWQNAIPQTQQSISSGQRQSMRGWTPTQSQATLSAGGESPPASSRASLSSSTGRPPLYPVPLPGTERDGILFPPASTQQPTREPRKPTASTSAAASNSEQYPDGAQLVKAMQESHKGGEGGDSLCPCFNGGGSCFTRKGSVFGSMFG